MLNFDITGIGIKNFYTYRSNRCKHSFVIYNLSKEDVDDLKDYLEEYGYRLDNHISWENKKGLCFTYSDHNLYIGTEMLNHSW